MAQSAAKSWVILDGSFSSRLSFAARPGCSNCSCTPCPLTGHPIPNGICGTAILRHLLGGLLFCKPTLDTRVLKCSLHAYDFKCALASSLCVPVELFLLRVHLHFLPAVRRQLFNAIVAVFMSFFAAFAFIMYPNHELLHPHGAADALSQVGTGSARCNNLVTGRFRICSIAAISLQ
eukprot:scaffold134012_cov18-Tisochrysis_lutea.AAC.1